MLVANIEKQNLSNEKLHRRVGGELNGYSMLGGSYGAACKNFIKWSPDLTKKHILNNWTSLAVSSSDLRGVL